MGKNDLDQVSDVVEASLETPVISRDGADGSRSPSADWEAIERDYRAGLMSLREIAGQHGITEGAIRKRAKRDGWERDLSAKIQAQADALVRKAEVRAEVRNERTATEREIVEANAAAIAAIRLEHRADIRAGRELAKRLLVELAGLTDHPEFSESLVDALAVSEDWTDEERAKQARKLRELLERATALPGRIGMLKTLSEAQKNWIGMDRESWNMDEATTGSGGFERLLVEVFAHVSAQR